MPAKPVKRGDKWRIINADTGELIKRNGSPVDGGGHESRDTALKQAKAVNANES